MTVCIAAANWTLNKIVFVSDGLLSAEWISAKGGIKFIPITDDAPWVMMFAGEERRFAPLHTAISSELYKKSGRELIDVVDACESAYKIKILKHVEMEILAPLGLTREDFIQHGREWFGEARFTAILDQILAMDLGIEILVGGFEPDKNPSLFSVSTRGASSQHVQPALHAIGSGAFAALGALYPDAEKILGESAPIEEVVYRLCAAKFIAECAAGVGDETNVLILNADGTDNVLYIDTVAELRRRWQAEGRPKMPAGAAEMITEDLRRSTRHKSPAQG